LKTQILVFDFLPKNEISLFEPRLELCLRVSTHTHIKNLHLSGREQGEQTLPLNASAERNMGTSPALLGRLTGAEYKLRLGQAPLLPAPCPFSSC